MNTRQRLEGLCIQRNRAALLREVKRFIRRGSKGLGGQRGVGRGGQTPVSSAFFTQKRAGEPPGRRERGQIAITPTGWNGFGGPACTRTPSARGLSPDVLGTERALWLARAWTQQGAWRFGRDLFERIPAGSIHTPQARVLAAALYLSLGEIENALAALPPTTAWGPALSWVKKVGKVGGLSPPSTHPNSVDHISSPQTGDEIQPGESGSGGQTWRTWFWQRWLIENECLTIQGDYESALQSLEAIRIHMPELAKANSQHILSLQSYFEGHASSAESGIARLKSTLAAPPNLQSTHPRLFKVNCAVLGDLLVKTGETLAAKNFYLRALHATRRESHVLSPHSELGILIKIQSNELGNDKLKNRLLSYPDIPPALERRMQKMRMGEKFEILGTDPHQPHQPKKISVNLQNGEVTKDGKLRPDCPSELLLAALLLSSGPTGIGIPAVYPLLWPGESWNWFQFPERLSKLLVRLRRHYGIPVERKRNRLRIIHLRSSVIDRIGYFWGLSPLPTFLTTLNQKKKHEHVFRAEEVARFYGVSRRHSSNLLSQWLSKGWISRRGAGPTSVYLIQIEGAQAQKKQ